ncbi:2-amino-4-hydroxy-6-hydroxymethyldihydropteridine diphosphokinase [Roseovarius faecimaris]|uniref:2-amino-4-hydroxy-6-hydroxymethyldihydropteridine pyrophosphokinase n=1 Tax=Roseovarius faecimaris TaxID=2494550 RepID=A0A6I6IQP8_9RHOB|nr:2-amino-4-hydroxy-6-hydroxymethyldihydropteridine diphosphokinase [Roseovarius faecimaris]QGX99409.1 2-amino-4-hydroxy-6-hydroxymethyldihydropteridine diphosphokinase [Roseovarius faecimaris]
MVTSGQEYLIALGGNLRSELGVPQQTLRAALARLEQIGVQLKAVSAFYRTPCFPPGAGPDYVNAAAKIGYDGDPKEVLDLLHTVEAGLGRERVERWGRRTLDLDLIAAGSRVLPDEATHERWRNLPPERQVEATPDELILPHPRLQDRAFVLVPLADVAPDWVHPVLGLTVAEMVAGLPDEDVSDVVAL